MARDPKFVLEYLKQVETLATDILKDRREILELNKKRDKLREASRLDTPLTLDKLLIDPIIISNNHSCLNFSVKMCKIK